MKKNRKLALALAAVVSLGAFAQQSQNLKPGFYRVQNFKTQRYAYVCDNRGSINVPTTTADMGSIALFLQKYRDRCADPASLCYIEKVSNKHNIHGQNTSLYDIVDHYVQIQDAKTSNGAAAYQITPLLAGHTIYLQDEKNTTRDDDQYAGSTAAGPWNAPKDDTYYWNFISFTPNGDEYLGIAPNEAMKVDGKYYKPYVIGFDMTFLSSGMKAYYVSAIKPDAVVLKEITGTIPYNTPVIIECSSTNPSDNRVNVSITKSPRINGNHLTANYFCYANHGTSAYTVYNPQTMRVLKVKGGKLTFGKVADDDKISTEQLAFAYVVNNEQRYDFKQCLQGNSSYLSVPTNFPEDLAVMTEEEYNATHGGAALSGDADGNGSVNVSDVNGNGGIVQMILNQTAENLSTADLNKDGKVTIVDIALLIKRLISNK